MGKLASGHPQRVTETVCPDSHERATPSTKTLGFVPQPNLRDFGDARLDWRGNVVEVRRERVV